MKAIQSLILSNTNPQPSLRTLKIYEHNYGYLPLHILRIIFSHFDEEELKKNIVPICQNWREAAEDPVLWKKLKINGNNVPLSYICEKIWQFNLLNKIVIRHRADSKLILRQICRCSVNLTHLVLRHCTDITEESLRHLITSCKNIESLDLKCSPFKCLILCEELVHAKALTEVNFSGNPHFLMKHIMTVVLNVPKINGLHLSDFKPKNKHLLNDADCYFMLTHTVFALKYLTLDCSILNSYTFCSILKCKNLEYLCLNYAFNFEGKKFANLWISLKKLKSLKVRFAHNLKDSNVKDLFESGRDIMKNIEVIDLTGCMQVGDEGLQAIAKCCTALKCLVVRNCIKVTSVLPILNKCNKLEMLNVAFCKNLFLGNHPVPTDLKELFICNIVEQMKFAKLVKQLNSGTVIRVCQNEFNKDTIKW